MSEVSFFSNVAHMHLRLQFIKNRNANNEDAKKLNVSVNVDVSFFLLLIAMQCVSMNNAECGGFTEGILQCSVGMSA